MRHDTTTLNAIATGLLGCKSVCGWDRIWDVHQLSEVRGNTVTERFERPTLQVIDAVVRDSRIGSSHSLVFEELKDQIRIGGRIVVISHAADVPLIKAKAQQAGLLFCSDQQTSVEHYLHVLTFLREVSGINVLSSAINDADIAESI